MATETFIVELRTKGARTTRKQIDAIGRSASQTRRTLAFLRSSLVVFAAISVFSRLGKSLVDFGQEMSNVKAISGATGKQFDELRNKAKQLGATTRFTATQAAEGMTFLSRAGFTANEVLSALPATLNLAQAGALDLGRAADIASNVLKGFRLEAEETERVADVLAKTSALTNTNVEQLGKALSFAAPGAAVLGVEIETTAAAIGALSDAGIQASRAGTGLRKIFIKLSEPIGKGAETVKNLGLGLADLNIKSKGLIPVLETLAKKNITLGEATKLVGERQATALLILLNSIPKLKQVNDANVKAIGTAKEMARIMDDNLNGALLKVKSAFEAVVLAVGDSGATGALRGFLDLLASVLRSVAKNADILIFAFETLAFVAGVQLATKALPKLITAFAALNRVMLANPIIRFLSIIIILSVALVKFADKITLGGEGLANLQDVGVATFNRIKEALAGFILGIKIGFSRLKRIVSSTFTGLFGDVDLSLRNILLTAALVVDRTVGLFKGLKKSVILIFSDFPAALELVFVTAFNLIAKAFQFLVNKLIVVVNFFLKKVGRDTIGEIGSLQIEVSKPAKELGQRLGAAIKEGILETTGATDLVKEIFAEADKLAADRKFAESATGGGGAFGGRGLPKPPPTIQDDTREGSGDKELKKREDALRSLEAAINPLLAAEDALAETQKIINEALEKNIKLRIDQKELINLTIRAQVGATQTTKQLAQEIEVLNNARIKGAISQEEEIKLIRDRNIAFLEGQRDFESGVERAFLKGTDAATNFAAQSERVITDAFKSAGDVLNNFFKTGELDAKSLIITLITLAAKLLTIKAIEAVGGGVGGIGGGGAGNGIGAIIAQSVIGGIGGGFVQGGSFTVGKNNAVANLGAGTDNRLIAFRADDGEEVTVTPRNKAAPGGGMQIIQNINVRDADSFKRSQGQNLMRGQAALMRVQRRR